MTEDKDKKNSSNGQDGTQPVRLLATGKRVRAVDLETYSEEEIGKGENLIKRDPDVQDLLRARYNKHWSPFDKNGNKGLPKVNSVVTSRMPIRSVVFDRNIEHHNVEEGEIFGTTTQEFKIIPNKNLFKEGINTQRATYNKNMWWRFITDGPLPLPDAPPPPNGPLPALTNISAVPAINNSIFDTGGPNLTENNVIRANFLAKLSWTFFNADEVEVFREDGDTLTRLGGSLTKEAFDTGASANLRRQQLREAISPQSKDRFLPASSPSPLKPATKFESRIETRARLRKEEFDRRQDAFNRSELGDLLQEAPRQDALRTNFNSGTLTTEISGLKTFRFIAKNEVGMVMVRVRYRGIVVGRNLVIAQTEEGPRISTVLNPPPSPPAPDTRFDNIVPTIDEEGVFFDHAFDISVPFSKKVLDRQNAPIGSLFADVRPTYNFFINNYEQVIGTSEAKETLLPNMYAFLTELRNENTDEKNTIFRQHITLAGTIPDVFIDITNQKGEKIGERDRGEYFDKYARAHGELMRLKPAEEAELTRKFTNLVTPISNIDLFKEFNEKRELFPMFFDISFSTDKTTQFAEVLEDSQLSNLLMKDIIEENISLDKKVFQVTAASQRQEERTEAELERAADRLNQQIRRSRTLRDRRAPEVTSRGVRNQGGIKLSVETTTEARELETWDVIRWLQQLSENPLGVFGPLDNGVFLGTYNNEIKLAESSQFNFFKNLLVIIFAGKVKRLVERELRTFEDILNGKLAYSETAFYKIEKRDAVSGQIVQNFFLPNSNDINILRFIDTQVKYNKKYTYDIFAYQLVVGNKYSYEIREITEDEARIAVHNMPSVKLIKVPYYEFTGRIMDSPPIFPDVDVIPYKSVNNRIKFHFNGNVGEYKLEPIIIEPSDVDIIKKLREAQMVSEEEFLHYAGDDHVSAFEIFRLSKKPRKFSDFTGKRIALVETDINSISVQSATAAAFIDHIIPNRKYYYIFRTIDNHGHISNPTPIYELEIVDNDGLVFPVVKTVELDMGESTKLCAKAVKKFIQIVPAFQQTLLNEEMSGLIVGGRRVASILNRQNFHLGMSEEQVWQKNFKIRLTSKKTGKKIDLNVSFEHNNVQKEDNQGKILNEGTKN